MSFETDLASVSAEPQSPPPGSFAADLARVSKKTPATSGDWFASIGVKPLEPPPAPSEVAKSPYDSLINEAAATHGVDPTFVKAILFKGEQSGERAVSHKGAVGIAQFMPETAKQYGVTDPTDPAQAIDGATRYLKDLLKQFNGDESLAAAAYNAGPGAVTRHGGIPPYPETQAYVPRVMEGRGSQAPDPGSTPGQPPPNEFYDYEAARKAGVTGPDASGHWPSEFKKPGHPNLVVGGFDTRNGKRVPGTPRMGEADLVAHGWDPQTAKRLAATPEPKPAPQFDYNAPDPFYAPVDLLKTTREGSAQIGRAATGAVEAVKTGDPKVAANAASDAIEGLMTVGSPLLLPAALTSLGTTAATVGVAMAASEAARAFAKKAGLDEAYQRLVGNAAGLAAVGYGGNRILKMAGIDRGAVDAKVGQVLKSIVKWYEGKTAPVRPALADTTIEGRVVASEPVGDAVIQGYPARVVPQGRPAPPAAPPLNVPAPIRPVEPPAPVAPPAPSWPPVATDHALPTPPPAETVVRQPAPPPPPPAAVAPPEPAPPVPPAVEPPTATLELPEGWRVSDGERPYQDEQGAWKINVDSGRGGRTGIYDFTTRAVQRSSPFSGNITSAPVSTAERLRLAGYETPELATSQPRTPVPDPEFADRLAMRRRLAQEQEARGVLSPDLQRGPSTNTAQLPASTPPVAAPEIPGAQAIRIRNKLQQRKAEKQAAFEARKAQSSPAPAEPIVPAEATIPEVLPPEAPTPTSLVRRAPKKPVTAGTVRLAESVVRSRPLPQVIEEANALIDRLYEARHTNPNAEANDVVPSLPVYEVVLHTNPNAILDSETGFWSAKGANPAKPTTISDAPLQKSHSAVDAAIAKNRETPEPVVEAPAPAPRLTYDEFAAQYRNAFAQSMKYKPSEVGSQVFTEKMAKLADEYPEYLAQLEAAEEAAAKPPDPAPPVLEPEAKATEAPSILPEIPDTPAPTPSRAEVAKAAFQNQQLETAFQDWMSGAAYIDGSGNYHTKAPRSSRGPIAKWNKTVKARFETSDEFRKAAQEADPFGENVVRQVVHPMRGDIEVRGKGAATYWRELGDPDNRFVLASPEFRRGIEEAERRGATKAESEPPAPVATQPVAEAPKKEAAKAEKAADKVVAELRRVVDTKGVKTAAEVHRRVLAALESELEGAKEAAGFLSAEFKADKAYGGRPGKILINGEPIAEMGRYGQLKWWYPEDPAIEKLPLPGLGRTDDVSKAQLHLDALAAVTKALSQHRKAGTITIEIPGDGQFTIERNPWAIRRVIERITAGGTKPWQGLDAATLTKREIAEAGFNERRAERERQADASRDAFNARKKGRRK